ncbi:helix-turn-helix domain-containing protein [Deinococcus hohokamensis]|uniref:Helix-turn-helix domain-containing protein n=1 Tax=Deinococcus hohokamensis TaxID=309883 RepID=A0ABV9I3V5_9DEIO
MPKDLTPTDQRIRDAVKDAMKQEPRVTQAALAERLGTSQPAVAALVNGSRGQIPQSLINLLDALGLEIVVQRKS